VSDTDEPQPRPGEIFRALAVFVEPPSAEHEAVSQTLDLGKLPSRAEHTDLFDLQLFPYASVYLGPEGMEGGEARDRIAGFWRVLELDPPREPDHLTVMLATYGALLDSAADAGDDAANWHHVARVFLHEHLLSWLPLYLRKVCDTTHGFYCAWAQQLRRVLGAAELGPPTSLALPAALREAPPLPDPRKESGEAFLDGLLAPVRAGFILIREDLAGLARDAELGRRIGERKFVLKNLLAQDGKTVLTRLADQAAWAAKAAPAAMPGVTARWWRQRAETTRALLTELAEEAE
jgi:TorA maturation chaperone TorD